MVSSVGTELCATAFTLIFRTPCSAAWTPMTLALMPADDAVLRGHQACD
jgi:hypothetical protein